MMPKDMFLSRWSLASVLLLTTTLALMNLSQETWLSLFDVQSLALKASPFSNDGTTMLNQRNTRMNKAFQASSSSQSPSLTDDDDDDVSPLSATSAQSCIPPQPLTWEWNYYSHNAAGTRRTRSKRLLIGLFSGYDKYAEMLELTAPINKAYARRWKQDVVVLQGTAYVLPIDKNCTPPGQRVTLNKIALLHAALERKDEYDQLLILDSDAMMYKFDFDVTSLLPDQFMVVAKRVYKTDSINTWNINAGVMLWNLHHELTERVVQAWESRCEKMIGLDPFMADQRPLHQVLQKKKDVQPHIRGVRGAFAYGHGTVVKHFIRRPQHRDWDDHSIVEDREERIVNTTAEICDRYPKDCIGLEKVRYRVSS